MRLPSPAGLVGALQVCSYIGKLTAKPVQPVVIELRVRKDLDYYNPDAINGIPYMSVNNVVLSSGFNDTAEFSDYQPISTTVTILKYLLAMRDQQRQASSFIKREELEKRQTFAGHTRKCDKKKKKYKLCDGIYDMVWNSVTKKCEICGKGMEPNGKTDKCVKKETPEDEKERGKCPLGMKLDPKVKGQDDKTPNPKCVDKDGKDGKDQNRCPKGQSQSSSTVSKPGKCAPDDEPDKKCTAKDTVVFKGIGPNGKIKNSCRTTRDQEWKKTQKFRDNLDKAKNKVMAPYYKKAKDRFKKEDKARARRSACLALGAVSFLPEADTLKLGDLEIEGLIEPDDKSHVPDIDLEDWMITIERPIFFPAVMETAGGAGIIKSLAEIFIDIFSKAKAGGKAAERPNIPISKSARVFGGQRFADLRNRKSVLFGKSASGDAKAAAAKSGAVKNILKSKTFQDCLLVGAGSALGAASSKREERSNTYKADVDADGDSYTIKIDLDAKKKNNYPAPDDTSKVLMVVADSTTDAGEDEVPDYMLSTYQDSYDRRDRVNYQGCSTFSGRGINNAATLLQTWNGCCVYYNGENCEHDTSMFSQYNREDGQLRGKDNDAVSSFWCTFDSNCAGAP